jgi:3-methyladenine DNA glycosylase AlkD
MLKWSAGSDIWLKRTAILHQLAYKDKTDIVLLEQIISNCLGSDEFFINKAIGWALREYSKTDPEWVESFISRRKNELSPLSIKEGSKYI